MIHSTDFSEQIQIEPNQKSDQDDQWYTECVSLPGVLSREKLSELWKYKFSALDLEFRPLEEKWIPQLRHIHAYCFPVKYSDNFYKQLLRKEYITVLVFHIPTDSIAVFGTARVDSRRDMKKGYIATLGVATELRKNGLGILMLRQLEYELLQQSIRPDIYELHVGTYNVAACKMYDRAKYDKVEFLKNHYVWDGKRHDGYLYQKMIPPASGKILWPPENKNVIQTEQKDNNNNSDSGSF